MLSLRVECNLYDLEIYITAETIIFCLVKQEVSGMHIQGEGNCESS